MQCTGSGVGKQREEPSTVRRIDDGFHRTRACSVRKKERKKEKEG
jgi:hypothetical protein